MVLPEKEEEEEEEEEEVVVGERGRKHLHMQNTNARALRRKLRELKGAFWDAAAARTWNEVSIKFSKFQFQNGQTKCVRFQLNVSVKP